MHYSFQSTGAHIFNFSNIKLEQDKRPEILYQRLMSFSEDKFLIANGHVTRHGEAVAHDDEKSPTFENMIVLTWLRLAHPARLVSHPVSTKYS